MASAMSTRRKDPPYIAQVGKVGRRTGIQVQERERDPETGMESIDGVFGGTGAKRKEGAYLTNVGKVGRKTGIQLQERARDPETGMESFDDVFSPAKQPDPPATNSRARRSAKAVQNAGAALLDESVETTDGIRAGPEEPFSPRKTTSRLSMPLPRSRSPLKTNLQSPARKDKSLALQSSPTRGDIVTSAMRSEYPRVQRRLDFSIADAPPASLRGSPRRRNADLPISTGLSNGPRLSPPLADPTLSEPEMDEGEDVLKEDFAPIVNDDDDVVAVQTEEEFLEDQPLLQDEEPDEEPEREPALEDDDYVVEEEAPLDVPTPPRPRGPPKSSTTAVAKTTAVKRGVGRPPKRKHDDADQHEEQPAPKRRGPGRPKGSGTGARQPPNPSIEIDNDTSVLIQRGPPRPKKSNGLYIMRREEESETMGTTRAGRKVSKPLEFWKGERIEYGVEEVPQLGNGGFKSYMPVVKEVLRAEEVLVTPKLANRGRKGSARSAGQPAKKTQRSHYVHDIIEEEEEEDAEAALAEPWESDPGRVIAPVQEWNPADPTGAHSAAFEDELAISAAAIVTRDIPNSTFKFAKTLTLPFFGSGMVDLPPGAIKKPKNSRKMQMVFFVHVGRVLVIVNETRFRIGAGGMWQVPRGNFYSIENDYDKPARIFFSQGCEVQMEEED